MNLIIAAHTDDIELAMGGTLNRLQDVSVLIFSSASNVDHNNGYDMISECIDSMSKYNITPIIENFDTRYFFRDFQEIRNIIYDYKKHLNPDVVYTHSLDSQHPDHKTIAQACDSIFLETTVYCFDDVRANQHSIINKWIKLNELDMNVKIKSLSKYTSQKDKYYFQPDLIRSKCKANALSIGHDGYAEGFTVLREVS